MMPYVVFSLRQDSLSRFPWRRMCALGGCETYSRVYVCANIWLAHICYDPTLGMNWSNLVVPPKWLHGPDLPSVPASMLGFNFIYCFSSKQLIIIFLLINNGLIGKSTA
jgi:hypothetical protein